MLRTRVLPAAFKLAIVTSVLGSCVALAAPPAELPLLPPPGKAPAPAKVPAPAAPVVVNRVSLELTVPVAELRKQMLRTMVQKLDPKADPKVDPVLPIVVKTNEPALGPPPQIKQADAKIPAAPEPLKPLPPPAPEVREIPDRPRLLIPRPPGARPILDRLAERPLVVGVVDRINETADMTYRIEVRSLEMTVIGNTFTCDVGAGFHSEGKAPGSARDATFKLRVTKDLVWNDAGKLELKDGSSKLWIDPNAPLVGFPALDINRVLQLNALLQLVSGVLDRELMKRLPGDNLPDLANIAPQLKERVPFLAVEEITAYPLRGDGKDITIALVIGFVPANKKVGDEVKIAAKPGPAPEPTMRGKIVFDKDGKPDVKFDPAR